MKAENWRAARYDYLDFVEHYCKQPLPLSWNAHLHLLKNLGKGKPLESKFKSSSIKMSLVNNFYTLGKSHTEQNLYKSFECFIVVLRVIEKKIRFASSKM